MSVKDGQGTPNQLDKIFDFYVNPKRDAAMSDSELRELVLAMALEKIKQFHCPNHRSTSFGVLRLLSIFLKLNIFVFNFLFIIMEIT